jgi:hypothetical protein
MEHTIDKSKPYIPLAGVATDGWSKDDSATATARKPSYGTIL